MDGHQLNAAIDDFSPTNTLTHARFQVDHSASLSGAGNLVGGIELEDFLETPCA